MCFILCAMDKLNVYELILNYVTHVNHIQVLLQWLKALNEARCDLRKPCILAQCPCVPITQEWEVFKRGQHSAKQRCSCLTRFNGFQLLPSRWPHYSACKSALGEGAAPDGWSRPSVTIKCQKTNLFGNPYYRNSPRTVCPLLILSRWLTYLLTSNLCLLLKINRQQTIHIDLSISRPPISEEGSCQI